MVFLSWFRAWNNTDFTYYLSYIIEFKIFVISFLHFKASITHLWTDFTNLESLFSKLVFSKELAIFLLLCVTPERQKKTLWPLFMDGVQGFLVLILSTLKGWVDQESTISKSLKFTGLICRILKSKKTNYLMEI